MQSKLLTLFAFAALAVAEFPRGLFLIRNVENGKVVTVQNGSIEPGANVVLTDKGPVTLPEQLWASDSGFLVNVRSSLVLTIPVGGSNTDLPTVLSGKSLTQEEQRDGINALPQLWDDNFRHLTLFDPRFSVGSGDDESDVVVKEFSASDLAQQWSFDKPEDY